MKQTLLVFLLVLGSCSRNQQSESAQVNLQPALESIKTDTMMTEIKALSSDEFEGRKPGSPGEQKTIAYMQQQFQQIGLKPGNPDGTYLQNVPLAGVLSKPQVDIAVKGRKLALTHKRDYIAISARYVPQTVVKDSGIVFVGYGVVAPEYGWDDYKDVDVKGKTILMLINDPPVPDPNDPSKLDNKMFGGSAMTYYGRWTYKYEIATQKGAAAAIIIHETGPAGYPFEVVSGSWGNENFGIQRPDNNMSRVPVEGWVTYDKASELLKMAGLDLAALKKAAIQKDFKPVTLEGASAGFKIQNTLRKIDSHNVIAKLEGSDPMLKDQYVVYTAHWDHFGRDPQLKGDQIFNGARDNASGSAGLLELARAFGKLSPAPRRSILFLSVTSEEQGLLGSQYYAVNPLYPLKNTVADFNIDEMNVWSKSTDMTIIGSGKSSLEDTVADVLKAHGRTAGPDPEPEKGRYYRSDHFEFAKQGVPAFYAIPGVDFVGKPAGFGKQVQADYDLKDYHKPSDEVKPDWDLAGAVDDLKILFEAGDRVAEEPKYPEWKSGSEFKAKRDEMMK
jgi:Zn-dependent M28 family amino/carboxypeptidase